MKRFLIIGLMLCTIIGYWPTGAHSQGRGADPELMLARQASADMGLFNALADGDMTLMAVMRNQGANPNVSLAILGLQVKDVFGSAMPVLDQPFDPTGWPILHWAVYLGNEEAVKLLIKSGARLNTPDVYGATALHWAAWGGRHNIAKLLLNNGANCAVRDIKRRTAKEWAVMMEQADMVQLLAGRTCRVAALDSDGDGVPDDQDLCPNTPLGAPVDERGCWVVAYASYFDFDKSVVKSQYLPAIRDAANVLKNHPDLVVTIEGHTDSVGSNEYNYGLGLRRAKAVQRIISEAGVSAGSLNISSCGETQPIAANDSRSGRARNRRVEIHVAQPVAVGQPAPVKQ